MLIGNAGNAKQVLTNGTDKPMLGFERMTENEYKLYLGLFCNQVERRFA
ncbi:hypothetical protein [Achromobacter sp. UMC71]|nr:hypothetical protein [Achromobacter sp. UMC71]